MKEKLYTIPVMDGFQENCECPLCAMYHTLEENAVSYTMGPSYMESDNRDQTDAKGFCTVHLKRLYQHQNRLGLALMLHTHMKKVSAEVEKLSKHARPAKAGLFKKTESSPLQDYLDKLQGSCFICERVQETFDRFYATIFHLFCNDGEFMSVMKASKGLCTEHYKELYTRALKQLSGYELESFLTLIHELYLKNLSRVENELEWFIDKFDYENADKPWGTSQDALQRSMVKMGSIYYTPDENLKN